MVVVGEQEPLPAPWAPSLGLPPASPPSAELKWDAVRITLALRGQVSTQLGLGLVIPKSAGGPHPMQRVLPQPGPSLRVPPGWPWLGSGPEPGQGQHVLFSVSAAFLSSASCSRWRSWWVSSSALARAAWAASSCSCWGLTFSCPSSPCTCRQHGEDGDHGKRPWERHQGRGDPKGPFEPYFSESGREAWGRDSPGCMGQRG